MQLHFAKHVGIGVMHPYQLAALKRRKPASALAIRVVVVTVLLAAGLPITARQGKESDRRPRFTLSARPAVAMAPAKIAFAAELVGGANDFEDYYCPTLIWDWGDETSSESSSDCEPYLPGKSEIRRRFSGDHTFQRSGAYRVYVRLKRSNKEVAVASVNVQLRPGAQEY